MTGAWLFPILHVGGSYPTGFLHTSWKPDPETALTGLLLIVGYLLVNGPLNERYPGWQERTVTRRQRRFWIAGAVVLIVTLGPPFHDWSDDFLLSAHMFEHLSLMLIVAPLLMLGIPAWWFNPITRRPWLDRIGYQLTRPATSFVIGNLIMILWHVPYLFNGALLHQSLHAIQHDAFMLSAFFSWWPFIAPNPRWHKAEPLVQCILLFAETVPGGVIGMMLMLGGPGIYPYYDNAPRIFGITLANDQIIAGGMMAVGVPIFYLTLLTIIFLRWAGREEAKERAVPARRPPEPSPDAAVVS